MNRLFLCISFNLVVKFVYIYNKLTTISLIYSILIGFFSKKLISST